MTRRSFGFERSRNSKNVFTRSHYRIAGVILAVVIWSLPAAQTQAAVVSVNGSFDDQVGDITPQNGTTFGQVFSSITGWTASGSGALRLANGNTSGPPYYAGNGSTIPNQFPTDGGTYLPFDGANYTLTQSIPRLIPGPVDVSFDLIRLTAGVGGSTTARVELFDGPSAGSPSLYDSGTINITGLPQETWTSFSSGMLFNTGSTMFLRLTLFDNTSAGLGGIDNLVVNGTAIPEPSTGMLLGLGLVGLASRRRRRRAFNRTSTCKNTNSNKFISKSFATATVLLASVLFAASASTANATLLVLDDDFDNGVLGTNPSGVGGGFQSLNNPEGSGGSAVESGTDVTITDGAGTSNARNYAILSTNSFNVPNALVATWKVSAYNLTTTSGTRRIQFLLQSGTGFNVTENTRAMRIEFDPVANDVVLLFKDGVNPNQSFTQSFSNIVVLDNDGFTLTATFNQDGYSVVTSGLNATAEANLSGTFPTTNGLTYDSVFGAGNMYVSAVAFSFNSTATLAIDRITLTAVPEPSSAVLLGLGLLGAGLRRRRK